MPFLQLQSGNLSFMIYDDVSGSYQVLYFERVDFNHFPLLLSSKGRGGKRLVVKMRNGFGPCLPAGAKAE